MADNQLRVDVQLQVTTTLSEAECRALDALVGYGADAFLKVFYEKLGKAYMQPHEAGLRSLFESIGRDVRPYLSRIDSARKTFNEGRLPCRG